MTRDDTHHLIREDVWRELELLPAWRLRVPVEGVLPNAIESKAIENFATAAPEKPTNTLARQYEVTMSQDKHWAFVNDKSTSEISMAAGRVDIALESTLFNNILHALSIEKPSKIQVESIADIQAKTMGAKIIVAMGESVAQTLLVSQERLESLRGKFHVVGHAQLLVTYDIVHLLANPLDKAKVWQDLCLARAYLQNLQSQD